MPRNKRGRSGPAWEDAKKALSGYDTAQLLKLISDLYAFSSENKDFINSRLAIAGDSLKPYKATIKEALYPDVFKKNARVEIGRAKKAISDYKKAAQNERGLLELMVFFVEWGNRFTVEYGDMGEEFYLSMERMFSKAIEALMNQDEETIAAYRPRLKQIVDSSNGIGYFYHDTLNDIFFNAFPGD